MFRIAIKDLRLFVTDRRALLMTFFMPIALISIFAMAFGGEKERDARPITLVVADLDNGSVSKAVITELDSLKSIEVKMLPVDSAERLVKTGEESSMLVFNKGFGDSLMMNKSLPLEMRFDQSKAMEIGIMQQALMSHLGRIIGEMKMKNAGPGFVSVDSAGKETPMVMPPPVAAQRGFDLRMTPLMEEKQGSPGLIQAVAGTAVMMLLFGLAAMGAGLLEEKETGTLKKLLYSPINPRGVIFGKMIASNIVALVQLSVLFGYAAYAFHLDLGKNVPALLLMMFTTAFACSGFGMFLASVAKSRQQVQMLSTLLVLSMSAIGGSMIPTFMMPAFMQKLSVLSVNYWSIQGFYDIYWRNLAFTDPHFLLRPGMLFLIGAGMMIVSLVFFKRNVSKL